MEIEDFSYLRCSRCKNVIILPIPYKNNITLLSNMCDAYNEINECCSDSCFLFSTIKYGIEEEHFELSDLPLKLRKEFLTEVIHKFECGKHLLVITKHNGDIITISVENNIVSMDYNDGNHPRILDILVD